VVIQVLENQWFEAVKKSGDFLMLNAFYEASVGEYKA